MKQTERDDASRCRYCGEKLSLIQRLSRAEFCNPRHKEAYQRDQDQIAISRLQQLVIEEREAELQSRMNTVAEPEGAWPEDEAAQMEAEVAPVEAPVAKAAPARVQPEPKTPKTQGPSLCGAVFQESLAAVGPRGPVQLEQHAEEIAPLRRVPEFEKSPQSPRLEPAGRHEFRHRVDSRSGDQRGKHPESPAEPPSGDLRFPALRVEAEDWKEALQRLRASYAGIPPLAGLIMIAGPQTLRFETRMRSVSPQPEQPVTQPVRSYKPGLARGTGMPGMAGAIRGLGTWRTRFGSEGNMLPQWEGELVEMTVAADWMPRYPVFYTTSPWDGEGFEAAFGLGPGRGEGPGGEGIDYGQPGGVIAVLETIGDRQPDQEAVRVDGPIRLVPAPAAAAAAGGSPSAAPVAAAQRGATADAMAAPGNAPRPAQESKAGPAGQPGANSGAATTGSQSGAGVGLGTGAPGAGNWGIGRGKPGAAGATGNGWGDGSGTGTGDGRGSVSVDALAALVRAARQSDRSRAPLRDLDIALLSEPAQPVMADPGTWRGLREGSARDLPARGPVWTKAPLELRSLNVEPAAQNFVEPPALPAATPCVLARRPEAPLALPQLELAPRAPWHPVWLSAALGVRRKMGIRAAALHYPGAVSIPPFAAPSLEFGRASRLQPAVPLPAPWVRIQERDPLPASVSVQPARPQSETRKPVRPEVGPGAPASRQQLSFGRIERPGGQWVLMRGSGETATFRLALDQLGPQESAAGRSSEQARLGPVAQHAPAPGRAAIPPSRGIVYRDLVLEREFVEPPLEPVVFQFGSSRGGVWQSRT